MSVLGGSSRQTAHTRSFAGLATGALVIGHLLGYLIAFPNGAERHEHLAAAGHGYFNSLGLLALAATGISLIALGARTLRGEGGASLVRTALLLACLQVPSFLLLEVVERHMDLAVTLADPGVLVGLLMQILMAAVIAALVCVFVRTVQLVAGLWRSRRTPSQPTRTYAPEILLRNGPDLLVGARRRAPPAQLPS